MKSSSLAITKREYLLDSNLYMYKDLTESALYFLDYNLYLHIAIAINYEILFEIMNYLKSPKKNADSKISWFTL